MSKYKGNRNAVKDNRTSNLIIRINKNLKDEIKEVAGKGNMSDWVLMAIRRRIQEDKYKKNQ